jgi:hypothetical protein
MEGKKKEEEKGVEKEEEEEENKKKEKKLFCNTFSVVRSIFHKQILHRQHLYTTEYKSAAQRCRTGVL